MGEVGCASGDVNYSTNGVKFDSGKKRMSLIPKGVLGEVLSVLEFGAKKYAPDNWQYVEDARTRYYDAMQRHIEAWWGGEVQDSETGENHLAHAICCAMFLMWFDADRDRTVKEFQCDLQEQLKARFGN